MLFAGMHRVALLWTFNALLFYAAYLVLYSYYCSSCHRPTQLSHYGCDVLLIYFAYYYKFGITKLQLQLPTQKNNMIIALIDWLTFKMGVGFQKTYIDKYHTKFEIFIRKLVFGLCTIINLHRCDLQKTQIKCSVLLYKFTFEFFWISSYYFPFPLG